MCGDCKYAFSEMPIHKIPLEEPCTCNSYDGSPPCNPSDICHDCHHMKDF